MKASRVVDQAAYLLFLIYQITSQRCQPGWIMLNSKCILFEPKRLSYAGAIQNCKSKGGRLFEPKNIHANLRIAEMAYGKMNFPLDYWIGIDELATSGVFMYNYSGSPIKYANWGKPSNYDLNPIKNVEHCVSVLVVTGFWQKEPCSPIPYKMSVCEDLKDDLWYWGPCEHGWNLINGKCYKLVDLPMKFEAAHHLCQSLGGKVFEPTFESEEETVLNFYFGEHQSQAVWLGITDQLTEGRFIYASNEQPVEYTNWANNRYQDQSKILANTDEDCVMVQGRVWDEVCCQIGNVAKPLCEEKTIPGCKTEPNWESARGRCFYLGKSMKTYAEAITDCESKGGRLFEPRSPDSNVLIYEYMKNSASLPFWIGVNARDNHSRFIYTNSRDLVSYFNWDDGQPFADNYQAHCVVLQTHQAQWGTFHCEAKRNYVCEFPEVFQPFWDTISLPKSTTESYDFIFDLLFDFKQQPIVSSATSLLEGSNRFLSIGGFISYIKDVQEASTFNFVYRVDLDTNFICYHSAFPTTIKEAHTFEFKNQLHVCSAFTGISTETLLCWKWGQNGWESVPTPPGNTISKFISSVYVPNVGMWFVDDNSTSSLILSEATETFVPGLHWTNGRLRACTVMLTPTKVAQIGGDGIGALAATIDTYDFATNIEVVNASQLTEIRKHHSCAVLKGKNGNPTVAIIGGILAPYKFFMELWDSVEMTSHRVPHPFELESNTLFRPTLVPFDETSVLLVNSEVNLPGPIPTYLQNIYKYTYGIGWQVVAKNPKPLNSIEQSGVYMMRNRNLEHYKSLDNCAPPK